MASVIAVKPLTNAVRKPSASQKLMMPSVMTMPSRSVSLRVWPPPLIGKASPRGSSGEMST